MDKEIELLCKTIAKDLARLHKGDTASALWPFIPNEAEYYVGTYFIKELYNQIKVLKEKGYSSSEIATLFKNPSKIAQYFTLFHSATILDYPKRIELTKDLINLLKYYRKDVFCLDENNVLNTSLNLKLENLESEEEYLEFSKKISAILLLYLEVLYPTMMRLGHEFHGVYQEKGKKIFIKDFFNMVPSSLGLVEKFPAKEIRIVEEIEESLKIDFFNHLIFPPQVKRTYVQVDNNILNKTELKEFYFLLEKRVNEIILKTVNFTRKDWFKVYSKGLFNSFSSLKEKSKTEGGIPPEVFKKIESEDFRLPIDKIVEFNKVHSQEEIEKITLNSFIKIFDQDK